jgi:hypothetical protein
VVGFLIGLRHPGHRPFLLGFELFGALALAFYITLACFSASPQDIRRNYVNVFVDPVIEIMRRQPNLIFIPTVWFVVVVVLALPQVVFALIGGFLSRWCQFTITRRQEGTPS